MRVENVKVDLESLGIELERMMDDELKRIKKATNSSVVEVTKEAKDEVKNSGTYQDWSGKYRKNISYKIKSKKGMKTGVIFGDNGQYRLAHLLEHGHRLWQSPGRRTRPFPHYKQGEQYANDELPDRIREKIER